MASILQYHNFSGNNLTTSLLIDELRELRILKTNFFNKQNEDNIIT